MEGWYIKSKLQVLYVLTDKVKKLYFQQINQDKRRHQQMQEEKWTIGFFKMHFCTYPEMQWDSTQGQESNQIGIFVGVLDYLVQKYSIGSE